MLQPLIFLFFFFNDTATTEIYTLSLHDALPISDAHSARKLGGEGWSNLLNRDCLGVINNAIAFKSNLKRNLEIFNNRDRKSTRLNSSHSQISYAVFCLKKKKK